MRWQPQGFPKDLDVDDCFAYDGKCGGMDTIPIVDAHVVVVVAVVDNDAVDYDDDVRRYDNIVAGNNVVDGVMQHRD